MAKTSTSTVKLSKEEKKAAKITAKAAKKERRGQIWQAFQTQRKEDKRLLPYMILCLVGSAVAFSALGYLLATWWAGLVFGLIIGVMVALIFFARRVQSNVYKQADGTPGAAAWSLQNNQLRGKWRITPAIAGTSHLDAVHRVVGRPGIILIGEGATHRVKPLLAQEKKKIARIVGETPIYDIIVGNEEGQTPLKKLNSSLMKLPRNITAAQVSDLDSRLAALSARIGQAGMPKGPLPAGTKTRNVQRAARRR
ncbi:hypothetical protein ABIB25_004622 [Nakamurella sp. UYEF19]|uniref:DUF4191 domain-containing protein n=1 Tax=Nakamurella sp. UYEF19 TaxID=1756392 RepID=UPI0033933965